MAPYYTTSYFTTDHTGGHWSSAASSVTYVIQDTSTAAWCVQLNATTVMNSYNQNNYNWGNVTLAPVSPEQIEKEKAAKVKAERLLVSVLNRRQRREFREDGFFHVYTRNDVRKYRLRPGSTPIRVRDENNEQSYFCIHPLGVPSADVVVAQKLMLETDEDAFLRIANRTRVTAALAA